MSHSPQARIAELHLLTYRPAEMITWWTALLGGHTHALGARTTAITTDAARVVIEHLDIALDYHPEASGVTVISVSPGDANALRDTVNRLADIGSHPHRATRHGGVTTLWFRDPNRTTVTLPLSTIDSTEATGTDLFPDDLDPDAVLQTLDGLTQRHREDPNP
jgi:hypothetical protein